MPTAAPLPRVPPFLRRHPGWWALWLISRLPFRVLYLLADFVAFVLYRVAGYRREVVRENLARSFPEKSEAERRLIERRFYRNLADVLVETVKLCSVKPRKLVQRMRYVGLEAVTRLLDQGQTVLVLGSHLGNWEWMLPVANTTYGYRADVVYRPLASSFAEALLTHLRTRAGGQLIRVQDVGQNVVRQRAVTRAVCMVADQPPEGEAQFYTTFLNQRTPFFVGTDKLAASFRMPVFYLAVRRIRRGYYEAIPQLLYDGVEPLAPPPRYVTDDPALHPITAAYARALEADIRRSPASYLWTRRRWQDAREQRSTGAGGRGGS